MATSVLYIIGQLGRGGAERQLYLLLETLRPEAKVVVLSRGGAWAERIRELGIPVLELPRRGHADLRRLRLVRRAILEFRPDIVHIFTDGPPGLYGRIGALLAGHHCVVVGDRQHGSAEPLWYRGIKRHLNRFVSVVVTNSEVSHSYIVAHGLAEEERVVCVPNGIRTEALEPGSLDLADLWDPPRADVVAFVGRLAPVKQPELFIRAAAAVRARMPDVGFVMVGDGPMRPQLETLRESLQLTPALQFLGERDDVAQLLPTASIFVLTSRSEGMPNTVMEAMRAGLSCVAPRVGACPELLQDGECGALIDGVGPHAYAEAIVGLLCNPDERARMGSAAQRRILTYSLARMARGYDNVYAAALQGHRSGRWRHD